MTLLISLLLLMMSAAYYSDCQDAYRLVLAPCEAAFEECFGPHRIAMTSCTTGCRENELRCFDRDCCQEDCRRQTDEAWHVCYDELDLCRNPLFDDMIRCADLHRHSEFAACLTGPDGGGVWCQIRGSLWDMFTGGIVPTCLNELPEWCKGHDWDQDKDVDLRDLAELWSNNE